MKIGSIEFLPKRAFRSTPALILAGACWIGYCGALLLEFSQHTRYTEIALGSSHIWIAAITAWALMVLCGVFWKRASITRGSYAIGCVLGAIFVSLAGYYIEREFFHATWSAEKSKRILILGGNLMLLPIALLTTPGFLKITRERLDLERPQSAEQVAEPDL